MRISAQCEIGGVNWATSRCHEHVCPLDYPMRDRQRKAVIERCAKSACRSENSGEEITAEGTFAILAERCPRSI